MPLKVLNLDPVSLVCAAEGLKLSVTSEITINLSTSNLATLGNPELITALLKHKAWVSRGRACRLDLQIFFNGKELPIVTRLRLLESLGYHLRDAHLWAQLSLSTSLEIGQQDSLHASADLSIFLNHSSHISTTNVHPRSWLLENSHVNPPESVLCAEFDKLNLRLDFASLDNPQQKIVKNIKHGKDLGSDVMLLDTATENDTGHTLERAVRKLSNLSTSITDCFNYPLPILMKPDKADAGQKRTTPKARLPTESVDILKSWFVSHLQNPTRSEKEDLAKRTMLSTKQIDNWMYKKRHRHRLSKAPAIIHTSDEADLLQYDTKPQNSHSLVGVQECQDEDIILLDDADPCFDSDEMLFSQPMSQAPSLISHSSSVSTGITSSLAYSSKRSLSLDEAPSTNICPMSSLKATVVCNFSAIALQILICGSTPRSHRSSSTIRMQGSSPTSTLAALSPSLFSPGYRQMVAHNAKYIPTLSNALCSTLVRNVQGPGLRQKLVALSEASVTELHDDKQIQGTAERMASVVQGRIWGMIQREVFDFRSAKKLKWASSLGDNGLFKDEMESWNDEEDLLGCDKEDIEDDGFTFIFDDDESPFDDFLLGDTESNDKDGLLSYLDERERREVEMETDEMLLGVDPEFGDDDRYLFLDSECDEMDSMLL